MKKIYFSLVFSVLIAGCNGGVGPYYGGSSGEYSLSDLTNNGNEYTPYDDSFYESFYNYYYDDSQYRQQNKYHWEDNSYSEPEQTPPKHDWSYPGYAHSEQEQTPPKHDWSYSGYAHSEQEQTPPKHDWSYPGYAHSEQEQTPPKHDWSYPKTEQNNSYDRHEKQEEKKKQQEGREEEKRRQREQERQEDKQKSKNEKEDSVPEKFWDKLISYQERRGLVQLIKEIFVGSRSKFKETLKIPLPSNPTDTELKNAYKEISLKYHPDKMPEATQDQKDAYLRLNQLFSEVLGSSKRQRGKN